MAFIWEQIRTRSVSNIGLTITYLNFHLNVQWAAHGLVSHLNEQTQHNETERAVDLSCIRVKKNPSLQKKLDFLSLDRTNM